MQPQRMKVVNIYVYLISLCAHFLVLKNNAICKLCCVTRFIWSFWLTFWNSKGAIIKNYMELSFTVCDGNSQNSILTKSAFYWPCQSYLYQSRANRGPNKPFPLKTSLHVCSRGEHWLQKTVVFICSWRRHTLVKWPQIERTSPANTHSFQNIFNWFHKSWWPTNQKKYVVKTSSANLDYSMSNGNLEKTF